MVVTIGRRSFTSVNFMSIPCGDALWRRAKSINSMDVPCGDTLFRRSYKSINFMDVPCGDTLFRRSYKSINFMDIPCGDALGSIVLSDPGAWWPESGMIQCTKIKGTKWKDGTD